MRLGRTIVRSIILLVIIWICIQLIGKYCFIVVRGDSMEPTLYSGDLLLVKKFPDTRKVSSKNSKFRIIASRLIINPSNDLINNNNIVILNQPYKYDQKIVKRCVGLPGDQVYLRSLDSLIVYSKSDSLTLYTSGLCFDLLNLRDSYLCSDTDYELKDNFSSSERKIRIPSNGYKIQLEKDCYQKYQKLFNSYTNIFFDESKNVFYKNGGMITEYIFECDYFYLIGDNMQNSYDSRQLGAYPKEFIFGKVVSIFSCHREAMIREK